MDFSRLPRRMLSCWITSKRPIGRPRFTYGDTVKKALQQFGFNEGSLGITLNVLAQKRCVWRSLISHGTFYNGSSRSDATASLARANRLLHNITNTDIPYRQPREPAEYITVPCMDIGHQNLVVAKAWVRGKHTLNPKVNLDMNGDSGFRIIGNPHA
jgi:hypothetical protein